MHFAGCQCTAHTHIVFGYDLNKFAVFAYSDMMWPLIVNSNINMMTLSAGISSMQGQYTTRYPILMAGSTLAMIPMLVLYLIFQRQFIEGIALTGTKG